MEHFTKAKLTHIFWQNLLESYDIPRLFRRSVQFLSKTVFLFLDKHKKNTQIPLQQYFFRYPMASNRAFCSAIPNQRPHISLFPPYSRWILPRTGKRRYLSLPHSAAFPPCKCRPKCPIFAARSAAKDFAACDSCPLLGKSASSHPHFLQIVLLNRYVTGSIFGFSCNDAKIRQIPPIYPSSLLTGP